MKYTEIAQLSSTELRNKLSEKKRELFELRIKLKTMQLQNYAEIKRVRRDIARIQTAISASKGA